MVTAGDGARLWTASGGRGPHLALAHGGPGLWDYLEPLARELEPLATVHRWDQRGGGRSERRRPYTLDRFVADMDDVRAAAGAERWVAGGHSWGASLALAYAVAHPERVRGVLYLAGVGVEWAAWAGAFRDEQARRLAALGGLDASLPEREANRRRWTADYGDPEVAAPHVRRMIDAGFEVNLDVNRAVHAEFVRRAPALLERFLRRPAPVLVVQGARDPRPAAAVDSMVAALPAWCVRRLVVEGGGHFPWVEEPAAVLGEIAGWLESLPAGAMLDR